MEQLIKTPAKPLLARKNYKVRVMSVMILTFALFFGNTADAQTQATGHVFAEIVEPVLLETNANNHHNIIFQDELGLNMNEIFLAEVILNGKNRNIGINIEAGHLESATGEKLVLNAIASYQNEHESTAGNESLFTLKGIPEMTSLTNVSNIFGGQYRVTFMYD